MAHGRGQRPPWNTINGNADPESDWRSAVRDLPVQLYARWQEDVARSRALFAEALTDAGPQWRGGDGLLSLRFILLSMIEEYARHNGHADLIRKAVDGLVGHDPPG